MEFFKSPPEIDFLKRDGANVADKWQKMKADNGPIYIKLAMPGKSEKDKCGAFLYMIGQMGCDIYNTITFVKDKIDKLDVLFTKFEMYCKNLTVGKYCFNMCVQEANETIDHLCN